MGGGGKQIELQSFRNNGSSDFLTELTSTIVVVTVSAGGSSRVYRCGGGAMATAGDVWRRRGGGGGVVGGACAFGNAVCVRNANEIRFSFAVGKSTCQFSDAAGPDRTPRRPGPPRTTKRSLPLRRL